MNIADDNQLKAWREKLGISQKRFAEVAGISLTTLRQFEDGLQKPHKKTMQKLAEVIQNIESGNFNQETLHPSRKRKNLAKVATSEVITAGGMPRIPEALPRILPNPIDSRQSDSQKPSPQLAGNVESTSATSLTSGVIHLSNLDLELINRVLNMTGKEKLALLEQLM